MSRREARPRSGLLAGLMGVVATLLLLAVAALVFAWSAYVGPGPRASEGDETVVVLTSGSGVASIGQRLHEAGVIRSPEMFRLAASLSGSDRRLRAGEYRIASRSSLRDVIQKLVSGDVVRHFVTVPEGRASVQVVDILMNSAVLTGEVEVPPEGSVLPDTYEVVRGESRAAVLARMQQAQSTLLERLWETRAPDLPIRTPQEAVILASIVEKETGIDGERALVAGVFVNRMRRGMRLESDPTIIYGITQGRPLGRGIRLSELQARTPYNTYQIDGLPPTPIANPGRAALEAVLNPPQTDYIFFVADGTGGHAFARTYDEHLRNVARWRQIERERAATPAVRPAPQDEAQTPAQTPAQPPAQPSLRPASPVEVPFE